MQSALCPVGDGGHWKHVAALLLTWLYNPESFAQITRHTNHLEQCSKPELIALVRQMLQPLS